MKEKSKRSKHLMNEKYPYLEISYGCSYQIGEKLSVQNTIYEVIKIERIPFNKEIHKKPDLGGIQRVWLKRIFEELEE